MVEKTNWEFHFTYQSFESSDPVPDRRFRPSNARYPIENEQG
jgi:hypothetical protein